jgi:hypothetical protein
MGEILELLAEFESIDVDLDVSGLKLRLSFTQSNVEFFFSLQSTYKSLYCFDERHYHPKWALHSALANYLNRCFPPVD